MLDSEAQPTEQKRWVVDWEKVEATVGENKEEEKGGNKEQWYKELEGNTAYERLIDFRKRHLKQIDIGGRSKRWWDEELTDLSSVVRRARRGGVGSGARGNHSNTERLA